jgi:tRNA A-37 threonylcarbamoyl transferase component Bud32
MIERWWVAREAEQALRTRAIDGIDACVAASREGTTLSSDRQSAAVRVPGDPPLLVKWRHTLPPRRWRTWLRRSRERREARAALRARAHGVPTPSPWAVGERRSGAGTLIAAALVRPFLSGHACVADRTSDATLRDVVAGSLRRWHDAGFRHGNCFPKNLLLAPTGEVVAIGFPAARFVRPGPRWDRARRRDLGQITAALALDPGGDAVERFLDAYVAAPGMGDRSSIERRVAPHRRRVLRRKERRRSTQPSREPHGAPAPTPPPPAPGVRLRRAPLAGSDETPVARATEPR